MWDANKEIERAAQKKEVVGWVRGYLKTNAFSDRKLTDVPTDDLQVVNRRYVTANGLIADRPSNPSPGQFYLAGQQPMWFVSGIGWTNGIGSVVASA